MAAVGASLAVVGVASAVGQPTAQAPTVAASVQSEPVGPSATAVQPASDSPAPSGGTSEVVRGTVASTSSVALTSSGQPVYYGTDPATMTTQRTSGGLVVTVAPR